MIELLDFLQELHPMSAELEQEIRKALRLKELGKGKHWLRTGEICNSIAFIEEGLMKVYTDVFDREVVLWFHKELDPVIAGKSYLRGQPSELAIKALEPTKVWYIERADLVRICERHASFHNNIRAITETYYTYSEEHVLLMYMPAAERYYNLMQLLPWTDTRVRDKEIAAYLGISPSCLSMIKNGKMKRA